MNNSIINKEWQKLRLYVWGFLFIIISSVAYFVLQINHAFSTIEPESMMWYQFSNLGYKPYFNFVYLFFIIGCVISLAQFIPEVIRDRIKIMIHLPCNFSNIVFRHLLIGSVFVVSLCLVLSSFLLIVILNYFPNIIASVVVKDILFYTLIAVSSYILSSSVIIEKKSIVKFFKFLFTLSFFICLIKEKYFIEDFIWFITLFFIPFLTLDSFYSIKKQRLESLYFKVFTIMIILFISFNTYVLYTKNYKTQFNKYYIFYSNIINDFVYQRNYGDHNFEYGIKDKSVFTQEKYESLLPFVYWKNLDIQNKLPVKIDNEIYTKKSIKDSRMSFNYHPKYLEKSELNLYPLFNPLSKKGVIKFPEEMFSFTNKEVVVYNYDDDISEEISKDINEKLNQLDIQYPILNVWGKETNLKPHDQGYLIEDSNHNLFNLKRFDNNIEVKQINYPSNIDLKYIKISENKQKILSGYVIDKKNNVYFLTWDFSLIKLHTPNFNHLKMKLKIISDPMTYLIRYDDGKNYFSVAYDKKFNLIGEIVLENKRGINE